MKCAVTRQKSTVPLPKRILRNCPSESGMQSKAMLELEEPIDLTERAGEPQDCQRCGGKILFDGEESKCFMCSMRPQEVAV